jgi:hypothetical protein
VNAELVHISISSASDRIEWREDLKQLSKQCDVQHQSTTFVIDEGQILFPLQIEDIANLVTYSGVLLLFSLEEIQVIKLEVPRSELKPCDNDRALFIQRLSRNLHVVLVVFHLAQSTKTSASPSRLSARTA